MAAANFIARGVTLVSRHKLLTAALGVFVGIPAVCLLFIWLALPGIVQSQAKAYVLARGGDRLTMERLAIVPLFEPRLSIDNLSLKQPDGSLLLGFKQLTVRLSLAGLFRGTWVIDEIALTGPQAVIALLPKGQLNWGSLIGSSQAKGGGSESPPPRLVIRKFSLADGQIDLVDRRSTVVQSVQIKPLAITLSDLSTLPSDKKGEYALSAKSSLGAEVEWNGTVSLTPLSIAGSLKLDGLSLTRLGALLPLPPRLAPPQGTARLATRYEAGIVDSKFDAKLADLAIGIDGLRIAGKQTPDAVLALGHLGLAGGAFDWQSRRIAVGSLTLSGGGITARRRADGTTDLLDLLPPSPPRPAARKPPTPLLPTVKPGPSPSPGAATAPADAWHYRVDRLSLTGFGVAFRDETVTPAADFALQDITAEIKGASETLTTPLPVRFAFRAREGGSVALDGTIIPGAPSAELHLSIDALALAPIQPYLAGATILKLVGGTLSADGKASYGKNLGGYAGALAVRALRIMAGEGPRPFLAWKALSTDSLTADPTRVAIRDLRLDGLDTALIVAKDRSVNVAQILRPAKNKPAVPSLPAAAAPPPSPPSPSPPLTTASATVTPAIDIERFQIRHSQLDYADLSLALPFATHIHDLEGEVTNISSRPAATPARVRLAGGIDEAGSASASGRIDLLKPTAFLDIDTNFDNIELTHLTPYMATFAGRRIDSGTLSLHLQYKIDHGQLAGDNRIILDQLTLGGRVRSPEARDLPLDFAIALLKDSHGRIDLGIPISGSLADPQFSYAKLIWKAVSNVLTRLVTSPFRALGAVFGGGGGSGGDVSFIVGQSSLTPAAQKSLAQIAGSLNSRPSLAVTIHGTWTAADRVALQDQKLRRAVADKLGLPAGADLAGLKPDKPEVQEALESLYADGNGQGGLIALKEGYRQSNAGKLEESVGDRALSLMTGLLGRKPTLGAAEIAGMKGLDFHAMLYRRLRDGEDVADEALRDLARARGEAAVRVLRDAKVPADRVILQPPERAVATGHDVPLAMALRPLIQPGAAGTPKPESE